ncbi:hypothetical protein Y032_0073g738 [Ancylostoma ceylanicum]|uniref:Uncharacterized protein n=1 Tax=Ancylostoma ceylanicum TaxID=53326 RepID=A0A016TW35_9BILA|nr:hypothetical protein Y032_0073g738 [Ancylostoma ceylanicum]
MKKDFGEFSAELDKMEYFRIADPVNTRGAIEQINKIHHNGERANCIVFISAEKNAQQLPKLNPGHMQLEKIVAVGFNNTDLTSILPPSNGVAVRVPLYFRDEHVTNVVNAILRQHPTENFLANFPKGVYSPRKPHCKRPFTYIQKDRLGPDGLVYQLIVRNFPVSFPQLEHRYLFGAQKRSITSWSLCQTSPLSKEFPRYASRIV